MARRRYEGAAGEELRAADAMPTHYLECRAVGHAWSIRWWGTISEMPEELVPRIVEAFRWDLARVSVCLRCHTVRDDFSSPLARYRTQHRRYRYPEGYRVPDGLGKEHAAQVAYERWIEGDTEFLSE